MANQIAKYLSFTASQGAPDGFAQATITTNLDPALGMAYKIVGLVCQHSPNLTAISADCSMTWALTRDTKAAAVNLSDVDAILVDGFFNALTTSGQITFPQSHSYDFVNGMYIVEPTVYFQLSSVTTGLASIMYGRIYYEEIKLSEVEILRLLNNA